MNFLRIFVFLSFLCSCTAATAYEMKYIDPTAPQGFSSLKVSCKITTNGKLDDLTDCPDQLFTYFLHDGASVMAGKRANATNLSPVNPEKPDNLPLGSINHADKYFAFFTVTSDSACIIEKGLNDEKKPTDMIIYFYMKDSLRFLYCELIHKAT